MEQTALEILFIGTPEEAEQTIQVLKRNNLANRLVHTCEGKEAMDFIFGIGEHTTSPSISKLILLNIKLPGVDGPGIIRKLKETGDKPMVPVIILASTKEEKEVIENYRLGVAGYLVKPVSFGDFN